MSSKYSLNGVYKCENFAQHVQNNNFPRFPIGSALGLDEWYIRIRVLVKDDGTWAYPYLGLHNHPKIRVQAYFDIFKKDGSPSFEIEWKHVYLESDEGCIGTYMNIDKLLDEKKGCLDEGALTVEYGIQVNSEKGEDGIWRFNLRDRFFNWKTKDDTFKFTYRYDSVFGHKQIIKLHSTTINTNKKSVPVPKLFGFDVLLMCIQITHGVRLQLTVIDYRNVARLACYLGFPNTVRYCEEQLIVVEPKLNITLLKLAVKCNMRFYLGNLLKRMETKKQLIDILRCLDLEEMSSESMKAIVTKIFCFILLVMSNRSKYGLNGIYRCEDFADYVENNDSPEFPIGSAFGLNGWYIDFRVLIYNGGTWVYPCIFHNRHPKVQIRVYFKIIKKDGSSAFEREFEHCYMESDEGCMGNYMNVEELLDENNGYLDEGALTVEYGLQVESVEGEDGIWGFNFYDKFFDWQTKDFMFELTRDNDSVFGHKQIIETDGN